MKRTPENSTVDTIFNSFPAWLRENSPIPSESVIQQHPTEQGRYVLTSQDRDIATYNSVYEAYTAAQEQGYSVTFARSLFEQNIVFTFSMEEGEETAAEVYEDHLVRTSILSNDENAYAIMTSTYAMMTSTIASWVYEMQEDFEYFYKTREQYLRNPTSFKHAYRFVHEHPMTWVKWDLNNETLWEPHDDFALLPVFDDESNDGAMYWILETGEHVPELDYRERYLDTELSIFDATSPEDAYIRLAANVEETFHPDGTRKVEVS